MHHYLHISCKNAIEQLQLRQVEGALQLVVVEGNFSWPGAIQPGFHEGGPRILQQKAATDVILAHTSGSGKHSPAAVMLHRIFSEEEVSEVADVIGGDEIWLC